jgi:hypothetical protein
MLAANHSRIGLLALSRRLSSEQRLYEPMEGLDFFREGVVTRFLANEYQ